MAWDYGSHQHPSPGPLVISFVVHRWVAVLGRYELALLLALVGGGCTVRWARHTNPDHYVLEGGVDRRRWS